MMDLDELKAKWTEHDRKLEEGIRLNRRILGAVQLGRTRSALNRLTVFTILHAALWVVCIGSLGDFVYEHASKSWLAVPAVALDLYAIGFLIALIRQIAAVRQIDYGQPVASIQKRLEGLRVMRIRTVQWGVLAGLVAWTPFAIVAMRAFFGVDLYRLFGPTWVWANLLFGLAAIPLAVWLSKKFAGRAGRSPFMQRLMADLAGNSLNAAARFLAELAEFERERAADDVN
jgi:hypothetical protein